MLVKYVRNKKNQRVGVVVAVSATQIGWSTCNFKMGDRFDKKRGREIAIGRAWKEEYERVDIYEVPFSVRWDVVEMTLRAGSYFKNLKKIGGV